MKDSETFESPPHKLRICESEPLTLNTSGLHCYIQHTGWQSSEAISELLLLDVEVYRSQMLTVSSYGNIACMFDGSEASASTLNPVAALSIDDGPRS